MIIKKNMPSPVADTVYSAIDFCAAMDILLMEPMGDGSFRLLAPGHQGIAPIYPEVRELTEGLRPDRRFPFVENFLVDAREIWTGPNGRIRSGPWIETDLRGKEYVLEAIAISWNNKNLLAIELLDETYREQYALLQHGRENVLLHQAVEAAKEEAERANRAKSEFLSAMSHELRTPLNTILGFAQLLEIADNLEPDQKEQMREIEKAGRHLLDLISELLDLAGIEAGHLQLSPDTIPLEDILDSCLSMAAPLARAQGISLSIDQGCRAMIRADTTRFRQVLLNLLSNAIKYNHPGGSVRVSCQPGEFDRSHIDFIDTGPGLDPKEQVDLFKPFARLNRKAHKIEGTGIGLVISKQLMELMGGDIGVESYPGQGSRFWIEIPNAEADSHPFSSSSHAAEATIVRDSGPDKKMMQPATILYVEDDPINRMLVDNIFKTQTPYTLLSAENAEQGLVLAATELPDLILLDNNLPDMDGYEVLERLGKNESTRSTPVVVYSADAMPEAIRRAKAAGFSEYVTKPLEVNSFLTTIEAVLSKRH